MVSARTIAAVMGGAAAGKSTFARALASATGWSWFDTQQYRDDHAEPTEAARLLANAQADHWAPV
jgi:cytidylate kinase